MDFQAIMQDKYLRYFLSDCEHSISDTMMIEFLNDMITLSEQVSMTEPLPKMIEEIKKKCGVEGSILNVVSLIANSDLVDNLNVFDVFALLWMVSCRNILTYDEELYLSMANNKTIGNLIKRLAVIYA